MNITQLKVPQWGNYDGLLHGFMGRRGGKSVGAYATLNVSYRVGDDAKVVSQNVCDIKQEVGIHDGRIVTMKQVHGDRVIEVNDKNLKEAGEGDAMVTETSDVFLSVLTADCVPILLVVPKKKIAAVVHAGWRGTLAGLGGMTIRQLKESYDLLANEIEAALGPAIGSCCYEVKDDVTRPLVAQWGHLSEAALQIREGKSFLDLKGLNQSILQQAGIPKRQIFQLGPCTRCAADEYFSYRREKKETGRQMSFIGWLGE